MPPPGPRHHHGWLENEEKVRSLQEIGERLAKIGTLLMERGNFRLGTTEVRPPGQCMFTVRLERMPRGELSLKLEMMWEEQEGAGAGYRPAADLEIESVE